MNLETDNWGLHIIGDINADFKDVIKEATAFVSTYYGAKNKSFNSYGKAIALMILEIDNLGLHNIGDIEADFKDVTVEATAFVSTCYGVIQLQVIQQHV